MPPADVDLAALVEEGRAKLAAMTPGEWTVFGLDDVPRGIVDLMLLAQVGGPNALNEAWVANMGPDCTPVINREQAPVDVPNAIGIVFLKNNAPTILSAAARTAQAEAESVRMRERERHFADALGVADGGQYRADWDAAICRVVAESTSLRAEVASLREQVTDLSRANDEAVADQLAFAKRVTETAAEVARLREALRQGGEVIALAYSDAQRDGCGANESHEAAMAAFHAFVDAALAPSTEKPDECRKALGEE